MIVTLNGLNVSVPPLSYLSFCLNMINFPPQGIAIAVNNTVISASEWEKYQLKENDNIAIFQAIAGG